MFEFGKIELSDRDWINDCLRQSNYRGCEYTFANNVAWQRLSNTQICRYKDFYVCCSFENGNPFFTYPAGSGDYAQLFHELKKYTKNLGKRFVLSSVKDEDVDFLKNDVGSVADVNLNRDSCDYIYKAEDLALMSGRKYHGKRNHIKRFKDNDWSFIPLTKEYFDDCTEFSTMFYNNNSNYDDFSAVVEQYAIDTYLQNFDYFGLLGGILLQNNEIVGFTIGEKVNCDTFVVHIEKALASVQGAYPTICHELAKYIADDFTYINREEDLGIEGLRKSKLSYHPEFLLNKYTVVFE